MPDSRLEVALDEAVTMALGAGVSRFAAPPQLAAAIRHAVFPGGARIRPRLCLAVARACGNADPVSAVAAAVSIELVHCASLVHDDLPCFDNAALRRGRPSVHQAFGERIALLAGDALIVAAFEHLARLVSGERLPALLITLAHATGASGGTIAGQALECESEVPLVAYQRAKTGGLFVAATVAGARAGGSLHPEAWRLCGECLGEAYQTADDIGDAIGRPEVLGKPVGQDALRHRPNSVRNSGVPAAVARLHTLVADALAAIPPCEGARALQEGIRIEFSRMLEERRLA